MGFPSFIGPAAPYAHLANFNAYAEQLAFYESIEKQMYPWLLVPTINDQYSMLVFPTLGPPDLIQLDNPFDVLQIQKAYGYKESIGDPTQTITSTPNILNIEKGFIKTEKTEKILVKQTELMFQRGSWTPIAWKEFFYLVEKRS